MATQDRTFSWNAGLLKKNNVVYHRSNKCAGTYLFSLLSANGWEEIQHYQIEKSDHHFGVILDPYIRRAKSITERIFMSNQQSRIDDPDFLRFIEDMCIVDEHMIPYSVQFKNIQPLTLFPLMKDHSIVAVLTAFLEQYNILLKPIENLHTHSSDAVKLSVCDKVHKALKWGVFEHIFKEDILLYEKNSTKFINTKKT